MQCRCKKNQPQTNANKPMEVQLPKLGAEALKLLRDRKGLKNYLESLQKAEILCLVPSYGVNK